MCDWDNTDINDVEIGIVGGGSMGSESCQPTYFISRGRKADPSFSPTHVRLSGGMTLLFAEHGSSVGAYDKDDSAVKKTLEEAKSTKSVDQSKVHGYSYVSPSSLP
jgi:6-phosphogluconate dehydrogenase